MNSTNQKYILEINKKLESFKNAKEWSDFISLLTSLDSTIKSYALPYIPKKELLIKRLEQCLNPLLPAGVHNKALETYSIIFETISKQELEDNFGIYTLGLFTFASHSRLLVMNHYLDVVEKHIIPFGSSIEIYSPNILMGLLPPLESKANEFYNRVMLILNNYKENIDESVFYSSLWNLFLSNSSVRLPIINYLLDTQNDLDKIAQDKSLVIRALCKGLDSKESLVLRGTLDIISTLFPLNTKKLTNVFKYDLLEGVLRLFLKRDLSLNKRVFGWMGYKDNSDKENLRVLKNTLSRYLDKEKDLSVFFKVFVTLATKSRLSEQILDCLLFKVLFQVRKVFQKEGKEISKELEDIKSYAKNFLTENLDVLWKLFYLKTKESVDYQHNKINSSNQLEEINISKDISAPREEQNETNVINLSGFFEDSENEDASDKMSPTEILFYIDFCCDNFNVFDENVLGTYLPIFVILILEYKSHFDEEKVINFLKKNVKRIKLVDQKDEIDDIILQKTDDFYINEDLNTLKLIRSAFCSCIIQRLHNFTDQEIENSHLFYIDFILNHYKAFRFDEYVKIYYKRLQNASSKTIGNSLRLFSVYGPELIKSESLFNELWNRFCQERVLGCQKENVYKQPEWNISIDTNNFASQVLKDPSETSIEDKNDLKDDYESKSADKKYIVVLIYDYNIVFNRKFEKYLLRKVSEETKHNICLFIHYLFELKDNSEYFFYNIFFIINNKISDQDPVITALIKSLVGFKGAFLFLLKKFEESNILSENHYYIDEPNLNQLKGVVCCLKNMILFSRRFRVMLKEMRMVCSNEILNCNDEIYCKTVVYRMLKYIFICEIKETNLSCDELSQFEAKNKKKAQQEAIILNRNIKIECIKLIMELANMKVIDKIDVVDNDLLFLVDYLKRYRLDPAIILPSSALIRLTGKQQILTEFSSICDSNCFYYFDLLEFIFQLPLEQKKNILKTILLQLGKDNYALMIKYEIIKEVIDIEDPTMNWSTIVQNIIKDSVNFYNENMFVFEENAKTNLLIENQSSNLKNDSFDTHTMNIKASAILAMANILYSKLSGYFIQHLISLPFPKEFIQDLDFKVHLFSTILSSYNGNLDRIFNFLLELYKLLNADERKRAYKESKKTLFEVINYRSETYPSTLLLLLTVFSEQTGSYEETSSFLSAIYQSISFINKNLDNKKFIDHSTFQGFTKLMNFLSNIVYTENIKSASQTYIGFLIDLLKHQDNSISTFALGELLVLSNNRSITESMWSKEFMDYLNHPNFFNFNLDKKSILAGKISTYKVEVIDDLISRLDTSFFVSLTSDISNKCSVLERMSFLILSAPFDIYNSFNIKLIEVIPNLVQHTSNKIRKNVLLLIRVMLYKINHNRLPTLFPILFSELIGVLERICDEDSGVVLECLKVIDMIFLLNTEEVMEFKNILSNKISLEDNKKGYLLTKALTKYKTRKDLEINYNYQVNPLRRLFFTSKSPSYDEIGSFMAVCGEFYESQDKVCSEIDKQEVEKVLLSEFEN